MTGWKTLSSKILHETKWLRLIEDTAKISSGKEIIYTYVQTVNPSVAIVAVRPGGDILIQKNYRHTIKESIWEIPAGHMEANETPLAAAKRELLEETGLTSSEWQSLGSIKLVAGIGDVTMYLFAATDVEVVTTKTDEDEAISRQLFVSNKKLNKMLNNNEIDSANSLVGIYRYLATIDMKKEE